jgi:hypothetical protein
MQHPYTYSKWDSIHDPFNVVENVLQEDEKIYKGLLPNFDFSLANGEMSYVAEVIIWPGEVGPSTVELYVGNSLDSWSLVKEYTCARDGPTRCVVPGEYTSRFLRVRCTQNVRGGNIVEVRYIVVKGLVSN